MREKEFSKWLQQECFLEGTINDYVSRCIRVENDLKIDLDDVFKKNTSESLLNDLTYTKEDQNNNCIPKCDIRFDEGADIYNGMRTLKTCVKTYFEFCKNTLSDR